MVYIIRAIKWGDCIGNSYNSYDNGKCICNKGYSQSFYPYKWFFF